MTTCSHAQGHPTCIGGPRKDRNALLGNSKSAQRVFVLYLFKRILQKQMDAYHGSLPHKYRKKNGEMGRGEWKMKHGKKGNKYLNIEV